MRPPTDSTAGLAADAGGVSGKGKAMSLFDELQSGIQAYDEFLAEIWAAAEGELVMNLHEQIAEAKESKDVKIERIDKFELRIQGPPALSLTETSNGQRLDVKIPAQGCWRLDLQARATIPKIGTHTYELSTDLSISATLHFSRASLTEATVLPGSQPQVELPGFSISSTNWLIRHALKAFQGVAREKAQTLIQGAIAGALPTHAAVQRIASYGLASEPPEDSADASSGALATAASSFGERSRAQEMPFGSLLSASVPADAVDARPENWANFQDSAIWTGHWVAAQAFRYAVTSGEEQKQAADWALRGLQGLEALIRVAGPPGLLSRVLVHADAPRSVIDALKRNALHHNAVFPGSYGGVDYLSEGHISRDQYVGAFLACAMALQHIDRADVQALAKKVAGEMVAYLHEVHWNPEHAAAETPGQKPMISTTYMTTPGQVLAILQLARRHVDPSYDAEFQKLRPMAPAAWLMEWLDTLDPNSHYYKFNLLHSTALVLLGLEEDPQELESLAGAFRTVRHALRYHANAYFNLVELTVFENRPDQLSRHRPTIVEEPRGFMARWLDRPPTRQSVDRRAVPIVRQESPPTVDFRGIGQSPKSNGTRIARMPLRADLRPGTDFLWQRSPFLLPKEPQPDSANLETRPPGVDLQLPYWMGRRLGLFD